MCFRQIGKARVLVVLTDVDVQLAIALDRNLVSHDGELGNGCADVPIARNF